MMNKEKRKTLGQAILVILLIAFALWFALKEQGSEIVGYLFQVSPSWLFLLFMLGILYYVLQGIALYFIANRYDQKITFWAGVENAYIAAFFNGVTPLGGGQVAQTYAFRKRCLSYANIATVLWIEFYLYQCVVTVYVLVMLASFHSLFVNETGYLLLILAGLLINVSVIFILWTMKHFPQFYLKMSDNGAKLLNKLHIIKDVNKLQQRSREYLSDFQKNISMIKNEKKMVFKVLALNIVRQSIYYSVPFLTAIALNIPIGWQDIGMIMSLSCAIHMLNALTPLPGDSGWTESMFILLFALVFTRSQASAIMLLWRFITFYMNMIIGGAIFLYIKTSK